MSKALKIKFKDYDDVAIFVGKPEALLISIDKEKVMVSVGKDYILQTNNNIQAYLKLYQALEGQEADIYIFEHFKNIIASTMNKKDFLNILERWFKN